MDEINIAEDAFASEEGAGSRVFFSAIGDGESAVSAARHLGLTLEEGGGRRRPNLSVTGAQVDLTLMVLTRERAQRPLRVISRRDGALIIGDPSALDIARTAVENSSRSPWSAVLALIKTVARHSEEELANLDETAQDIATAAVGYTSAVERREMAQLRADLFRIAESQAVQENLVSDDEELAETLGPEHDSNLARATRAFRANHATAMRVYAMLGDVLNEQDAVISERLTLVATIFLPLTLATGFFGMNFEWMTDRIGSFWAFLLLGIVVPSVIALATLLAIRRMTR